MLSSAIVTFALAASALANVFITSPTASTSLPAGQPANLSWTDSTEAPSLNEFGLATFAIYTGNANQQTLLQTLATSINVSALSTLAFTPQNSIGPNSGEYFIRVTSNTYKSGQDFQEAFSAKFTLTGMTGSFNSSVQAEIDGQSTAPIGGTSAASTPAATAGGSMTTMPSSTGSSAPATTSGASTSSTNGAGKPIVGTGIVALAAALVGASFL